MIIITDLLTLTTGNTLVSHHLQEEERRGEERREGEERRRGRGEERYSISLTCMRGKS